jgi:hypothetical protein
MLVANIDPQTSDQELIDTERKEIEICRTAIWGTARMQPQDSDGVRIIYEPNVFGGDDLANELISSVRFDWVTELLSSKGLISGFFQPNATLSGESFMDPNHEHFSPELALAVEAWRALEDVQKFSSSPKAAIETWLNNNPESWRGKEPISNVAKQRVITLVNWSKVGGAPRISG